MGVPQTKSELLLAIDKNFNKLSGYLNAVPPGLTSAKSMAGHVRGTTMSVHNLVAYLLGWNTLLAKWIYLDEEMEPVDFPETGYTWSQLGLLAQKFYADYEDMEFGILISNLGAAKKTIVSLIEERSDEELYGMSWYGKWPLGRMISFNTVAPYANACARLRAWAKENGVSLR
ncbi:ClbS/DfsB family four-helix bundle protein [Enterobacillus tribolii]|uniref:ClbS/DfsB family four-helix bundle protein n=1 Tax=Enterobacillus tribolii TaxID=1487935 RepID=A0A370QSF6_9GAMM|nr:ClbS/DfsB family four-helix bundle protein [Enterobacillus tribolii]MBW7983747.1 ClbS/DfsB family four-helix bundle protein [Enterobacillus tribolii]RDK92111.1 hypothetical protein C8D90_104269 [Enterobacillus tribolii]